MPKTKFQSIIFTLMMVFCMVYLMTVYTVSLKIGGLSYQIFVVAVKEMWLEYIIVFVLIFFAITKIALRLTARIIPKNSDTPPILSILATQSFTVCCIVPSITLIATFLHNGFTADWFIRWITSAAQCFPTALCLQIFFAGPLIRTVFRHIFS